MGCTTLKYSRRRPISGAVNADRHRQGAGATLRQPSIAMQTRPRRRLPLTGAFPSPLLRIATLAALSAWVGHAGATSIGPIIEQSALGEPLRLVIELPDDATDLDARCYAVVPPREPDGGAVAPPPTQMRLDRSARGPRLVVTSLKPVHDLALGLGIETICTPGLRRDYTVLLDPPVEAPRIAAPVVASIDPPAVQPAPPRRRAPEAAPASDADRRTTAEPAAPPPAKTRTAAPRDRVVVSRTLATAPGDPGAVAREMRKLKPEAQIAAVQEQETVLHNRVLALTQEVQAMQLERIAQLTAEVERMQARLAELESRAPPSRAAPAVAPTPATVPAAATAPAAEGPAPEWVSLATAAGGLVLVGGLVIAGMRWRARRNRREMGLMQDAEPEPPILYGKVAPAKAGAGPIATAAVSGMEVTLSAADGELPTYVEYLALGGVPDEEAHPQAPVDRELNMEFDEELMQAHRPPARAA